MNNIEKILKEKTVLSKREIDTVKYIETHKNFRDYMYLGNVAIKLYIDPKNKYRVNESPDVDLFIFDKKNLDELFNDKKSEIDYEETNPIMLGGVRRYGSKEIEQVIKDKKSPFKIYRLSIYTDRDYSIKSIDVFNPNIGVVFIPINEEDKKYIVKKHGLPIPCLEFLIPTIINPYGINKKRLERLTMALEDNKEEIKKEEIENLLYKKLKEGFEQFRREHPNKEEELIEMSIKGYNLLRNLEKKKRRVLEEVGILQTYYKVLQEEDIL